MGEFVRQGATHRIGSPRWCARDRPPPLGVRRYGLAADPSAMTCGGGSARGNGRGGGGGGNVAGRAEYPVIPATRSGIFASANDGMGGGGGSVSKRAACVIMAGGGGGADHEDFRGGSGAGGGGDAGRTGKSIGAKAFDAAGQTWSLADPPWYPSDPAARGDAAGAGVLGTGESRSVRKLRVAEVTTI